MLSITNLPRELCSIITEYIGYDIADIEYTIPDDIFDKYAKNFTPQDWINFSSNDSIPESTLEKYKHELDWAILCGVRDFSNPSILSEDFIERNLDYINERFPKARVDLIWESLSNNSTISEPFFRRHIDMLDWRFITSNNGVSLKFLEEHINKVDWTYISMRAFKGPNSLIKEFIDKYSSNIDWDVLSENTELPVWIMVQYKDKLDWMQLHRFNRSIGFYYKKLQVNKLLLDR